MGNLEDTEKTIKEGEKDKIVERGNNMETASEKPSTGAEKDGMEKTLSGKKRPDTLPKTLKPN